MAADAPQRFSKLAEELIGDFRQVPAKEPRRQIKRATKPLADLIESLMLKHQIGRSSPEQTIREQWAELVGPANATYSHPVRIDRGRLLVLVAHSVVRSELFAHREQIAEKIRALPGCEGVRNLNLRAG